MRWVPIRVRVDVGDQDVADAKYIHLVRSRRVQRGLTGLVVACMALLLVSCGVAGQSANADGSDVALVDLDADAVAAWTTVNDPVMGGSSTSKITFGGDGLVFSGSISLENNGGSPRPAVRRTPTSGARHRARSRSACALAATARPTC